MRIQLYASPCGQGLSLKTNSRCVCSWMYGVRIVREICILVSALCLWWNLLYTVHILWPLVYNYTFPKGHAPLLTLCPAAEPTKAAFSKFGYLSKLIHKSIAADSNWSEIPKEPDMNSSHEQNVLLAFFLFFSSSSPSCQHDVHK